MNEEPKPLPDWLRTEVLYLDGNPDWNVPASAIMLLSDAADALDRLALYETALRSIHEAIAKHVHPEPTMTKDEFIDAVLAAADNRHVVKAVRETSVGDSAMVVKALEDGK